MPSPLLLGVKVVTKRDAEPTLYSLMEYIVMLDLVGKKAAASVVHSACFLWERLNRAPLYGLYMVARISQVN